MRNLVQIKLNATGELKKWIEDRSKKEHRSLNGQAVYMLEMARLVILDKENKLGGGK